MPQGGLIPRLKAVLQPRNASVPESWDRRLSALEARVNHVESLVEGLQDAVHRDSVRLKEELDDLRHRTEPGEIARSLSDDARRRGL